MPSDFKKSLEKDVHIAYKQFKKKKSNEQGCKEATHESVLGHCVEASIFLRDQLRSKQYNAKIIHGGYNYPKEPTPTSYDDAQKIGTVHHWVQVDNQNDRYFCDIAPAEYQTHDSQKYKCFKNILPPDYIRF